MLVAARRAASFDDRDAFRKTRALWSAIQERIQPELGSEGAVFGRRAKCRWRQPGSGPDCGWAGIGHAATAAGRLIGDKRAAMA